jgi:serine/threonine protein kinase
MTHLLKPGDVLDDAYEIIEFISKGGFGAVYRARQLSMDRDVAVKLLIPGAQPDFTGLIQRFHNEVKAVRNLRHPNTVQIYDFHETSDEQLYFTMEYLEGCSLSDLIKQGEAISPRRTANILSQVLKSLAEAHSMGIIHRDIKPANIMLVDMYGEEDFVKVLDFGIAKALQGDEPAESEEPLTRTGFLVGTVRYMAPERIAGDPAGPYSDIYSLGLVAASLLIGQPILGNSSRLEAMQMQMGTKPLPIPESIKASPFGPLLDRALAKNPKDRFQSAEDMLQYVAALPATAFSEHPIHITGEVPILETLDDGTAAALEPTTVDSAVQSGPVQSSPVQSSPGFTAELAAGGGVPRPPSRSRRDETDSNRAPAGSAMPGTSKALVFLALGGLLLIAAGGLTFFLTSGGADDGAEAHQGVEIGDGPNPAGELVDEEQLADDRVAEPTKDAPTGHGTTRGDGTDDSAEEQRAQSAEAAPAPPEDDEPSAQAPSTPTPSTPTPSAQAPSTPTPPDDSTRSPETANKPAAKKQAPKKPAPKKSVEKPAAKKKPKAQSEDQDFIPVFGSEAPAKAEPDEPKDDDIPVF